jgi:hypothetical protein
MFLRAKHRKLELKAQKSISYFEIQSATSIIKLYQQNSFCATRILTFEFTGKTAFRALPETIGLFAQAGFALP